MTEAGTDRWRDEGGHALDGSFKPQNTKLVSATGSGYSNLNNDLQGTPSEGLPDGLQDVTITQTGYGNGPGIVGADDTLEVLCGPLLNYKSMRAMQSGAPIWHGSVLIVTKPGKRQPQLNLKSVDLTHADHVLKTNSPNYGSRDQGDVPVDLGQRSIHGTKLYEDPVKAFWRFDLELRLQESEARWEYFISHTRYVSCESSRASSAQTFVVPGASQSMRIMFHSCNGFSVGTDEEAWSGPALWNDVLRVHEQKPFHVMVGGGDQIYNDGVRVGGPLRAWTDIGNPRKRREYPFDEQLRNDCDGYYFQNYIKWFSTEPFASANSQIPQINIWDDHGNAVYLNFGYATAD